MQIEPISQSTQEAALRYLARSPYVNVFISHLLLANVPSPARKNVVVAVDREQIRGVAYCGRQFAIAADTSALEPFASHARRHRGERMIFGARETVRGYWDLVRAWHPRPRLVRDRQLVMMVDRTRLRRDGNLATVRHAKIEEWSAVADGSAAMVRQELAYDLRHDLPDFGANVRQMIKRKLWWVGVANGRLCFFCNTGPWCKRTIQLQGIWTPPELRGRGLATASLAAICDRLLEVSPTLSLYVNDFNEAAIALYRRVGFEHVADFQTILF
jgi:RimJ/RimL family protein N-acetyltransferase